MAQTAQPLISAPMPLARTALHVNPLKATSTAIVLTTTQVCIIFEKKLHKQLVNFKPDSVPVGQTKSGKL